MEFEILNMIRNRIIELDDLLYEPHLLTREDQSEILKEFNKLNKMLVIAEDKK